MAQAQRHVIKRQVVELTVSGGMARAQAVQDEISRICRDRLAPLFEKHFNRASGPDHILRVDRLELDLGVLDPEDLAGNFTARMDGVLERELTSLIRQDGEAEGGTEESPKIRSRLELFTLFLKTGCLPWWADMNRAKLLDENLEALLRESPEILADVLQTLIPDAAARTRLVRHADDRRLAAICALFVSSGRSSVEKDLPEFMKKIQWFTGSQAGLASARHMAEGESQPCGARHVQGGPAEIRFTFWSCFLETAASRVPRHGSPETFCRSAFRNLSDHPSIPFRADELEQMAGLERQARDGGAARVSGQGALGADDPEVLDFSGVSKETPVTPEAPASLGAAVIRTYFDAGFSTTAEYPLTNAGLVILWPFLNPFFTRLGLLDETRNFRDRSCRSRAAVLLQTVAAKDGEPPEYLLPLNKILCGIGVKDLVDVGSPVTEAETLECENLVRAVIEQAPVLRNMSSDGFRASFLLRDGVLSSRDGMGLLRVEGQTHDIVLARFPWTWEWVRLPWMKSPLRVEWE